MNRLLSFTNAAVIVFLPHLTFAQKQDTYPTPSHSYQEFLIDKKDKLQNLSSGLSRNGNTGKKKIRTISARQKATTKTAKGYIYSSWNSQEKRFELLAKNSIEFSDAVNFKSYLIDPFDTVQVVESTMSNDFENGDLIDFLLPGTTINEYLLRDIRGQFHGAYLTSVVKRKIHEQYVVSSSTNSRSILPFGSRYGETYSFQYCNENNAYAWEYIGKASVQEDHWIMELAVTQRQCETNDVIQEWKDVYKYNMRGNKVETKSYQKQGGSFQLIYHTQNGYDEQNRETFYISFLENKKYTFQYDEYGNYLSSQFNMDGSEWKQTYRTLREMVNQAFGISITYTHQQVVDGVWRDRWRYLYHYDKENRCTFVSQEYYDSATKEWDLGYYSKYMYHKNDLVKEEEYFYGEAIMGKDVYEYDVNDEVINSFRFSCAGQESCQQNDYTPLYKADHVPFANDTTDFWRSWMFVNGSWQKLDSVANRYDTDGDLSEMYHHFFASDERYRYQFQYKENLVTNVLTEHIDAALYPNPTTGLINIGFQNSKVAVYGVNGELFGSYINQPVLNLSDQPAGVYILFIESNGRFYRQKIIKR